MFPRSVLIVGLLLSWTSLSAAVGIDHLAPPTLYDNAGPPSVWGQTFVAQDGFVSGVQVFVGDPSRPTNPAVNALLGPADLVLYDATNLLSPVALATTQVVPSAASVDGLVTWLFSTPVATLLGTKYFFGIDTADSYGLGLRSQSASTFAGGAEAFLNVSTGVLTEASNGRDLSFAVLAPTAVPEPASLWLLVVGLGVAVGAQRLSRRCERT